MKTKISFKLKRDTNGDNYRYGTLVIPTEMTMKLKAGQEIQFLWLDKKDELEKRSNKINYYKNQVVNPEGLSCSADYARGN